jgi:hypothetical protein
MNACVNMPTNAGLREKAGYKRIEPIVIGTCNRLRRPVWVEIDRNVQVFGTLRPEKLII